MPESHYYDPPGLQGVKFDNAALNRALWRVLRSRIAERPDADFLNLAVTLGDVDVSLRDTGNSRYVKDIIIDATVAEELFSIPYPDVFEALFDDE